jgi:cell division septal protein FtsQ
VKSKTTKNLVNRSLLFFFFFFVFVVVGFFFFLKIKIKKLKSNINELRNRAS